MSQLNIDDNTVYNHVVKYLPTGEYLRWSDDLTYFYVCDDYDLTRLVNNISSGSHAVCPGNDETDFIHPVLVEHFQLIDLS